MRTPNSIKGHTQNGSNSVLPKQHLKELEGSMSAAVVVKLTGNAVIIRGSESIPLAITAWTVWTRTPWSAPLAGNSGKFLMIDFLAEHPKKPFGA